MCIRDRLRRVPDRLDRAADAVNKASSDTDNKMCIRDRKGRQIYVVYPLIKESETMDYKDLQDGYEAISRDFPLPEYVTTICHLSLIHI